MADDLTNACLSSHSADAVLPPSYTAAEYGEVRALTERLFPGPIDVRRELDPEIPDYDYLVFNVGACGTVEEVSARDAQWHHELAKIAPNPSHVYCLNIDIETSE